MNNYDWSEEVFQEIAYELDYGVKCGRIRHGGELHWNFGPRNEAPQPKDARYYRNLFWRVLHNIEQGKQAASDKEYSRIVKKWEFYNFKVNAPELYKQIHQQGLTYLQWWNSLEFPEQLKLRKEYLI